MSMIIFNLLKSAEAAIARVRELHTQTVSLEGKLLPFCAECKECWGCGEWGPSADCGCNAWPCATIRALDGEQK